MNNGAEEFAKFLKRLLKNPPQRRYLLQQWHSSTKKGEESENGRLATIFESFINIILFQPIRLHLQSDRFYIFQGLELPVFFNWVSREDQLFLIECMKHRKDVFKKRNDYMNNQFDYSECIYDCAIPLFWRQQIVRDFVWLITAKNDGFIKGELTAAVQWVKMERPNDQFLRNIHAGLQDKCHLDEVLCIN